ncbi:MULTISPECIES: ROK family protein [unclassified Pedobacter]|uniref:ROK family protein n=1 Tax=Pedobacter TaxID=84567 RepID=UPI000B4B56C2|nr:MULTISPECIES: ROK family protein [unclassified Pedobacter]MCX2430247.1 ROK family protein [Pedobacter sp. GR22-10]MCX2585862.1 ROK family protein [Pedobacter sp. MR22-3]OWK70227.1 chromosome partitioning protein ParA [Pedobacter sp. AJM]
MAAEKKVGQTNILSIDIGGTSIKTVLLDEDGNMLSEYMKSKTPAGATPKDIVSGIQDLIKPIPKTYNRVSIGFPGYVKNGMVKTAPNLAKNKWADVDLAQRVADALNQPVRLVNDADQQGLGVVEGKGFEIVFTVGTGFGTALLFDGELLPHLELAHFPINKDEDYDDYIGNKAFEDIGSERWNKRLKKIIEIYKTVFNYDALYIGGGNSKQIDFKLDSNITLVTNRDGIKGGAKLWKLADKYNIFTVHPKV